MLNLLLYALIGITTVGVIVGLLILTLRRIVPTNEVHIVQRNNETVSYGKDMDAGNVYYQYPSWIPKFGVVVSKLPTTVFYIDLKDYPAYDKEKLQFSVDVKAFFRIFDFNTAASRIFSVPELKTQLEGIVQGAVRSVLASDYLESIMVERTKYGNMFSDQVSAQLKEWGVVAVKNIELMDIKDAPNQCILDNIMTKKKSAIEKDKRVEVAKNMKLAQQAELETQQVVQIQQQEVIREVKLKEAAVGQEVGIANEKQQQQIQTEAKITAEKEMEVKKVRDIQAAEIEKQAAQIKAEQDKQVAILDAEADKQQEILKAQAHKQQVELQAEAEKTRIELRADAELKAAKNEAQGIKAKGESSATATELMEKAKVAGQIELKDKVTGDVEYQEFMIKQAQVEAMQAIGVEQAKNLSGADIKIYATAGSASEGLTQAGKVLNPNTGVNIASTLEAFANTEIGKSIADKFLNNKKEEN